MKSHIYNGDIAMGAPHSPERMQQMNLAYKKTIKNMVNAVDSLDVGNKLKHENGVHGFVKALIEATKAIEE